MPLNTQSVKLLAAQAAHDINNPLAYIVSNLRFCREQLEQDTLTQQERKDINDALADVQSGIEQILGIAQELKTIAAE